MELELHENPASSTDERLKEREVALIRPEGTLSL